MNSFSLRRIVTFHRTVEEALGFADPDRPNSLIRTIKDLNISDLDASALLTEHVNGTMSMKTRRAAMSVWDDPGHGAVVSNARCLEEGIDVPDLDAVAFLDERHSAVSILQAVGRVLRKPPTRPNKIGHVILPVVYDEETVCFSPVASILEALSAEDDVISDFIVRIQESSHGSRKSGSDLPNVVVERNFSFLSAQDVARAVAPKVSTRDLKWVSNYARLKDYANEHGHSSPKSGTKLGNWVRGQRDLGRRGLLTLGRRKKLESLPGWTWHPNSAKWDRAFRLLEDFVSEHGDVGVPISYVSESGFYLGQWVGQQKLAFRRKEPALTERRQKALESLPGWSWELERVTYNDVSVLLKFINENPGKDPPDDPVDGKNLLAIATCCKEKYLRGTLRASTVRELKKLPGWESL